MRWPSSDFDMVNTGMSVHEAVEDAARDVLDLTDGLLGGVTIHAVDREGNVCVVAANIRDSVSYWYWRETMPGPECLKARHIGIAPAPEPVNSTSL